jgi:SNF2 family DNA or RNA helicase
MLRRKKDTLVNGKALIELPPRKLDLVDCEFDDDERAFYDALNDKVQLTLNKFIKSGSVQNNYTSMLVLLLRLRQGEELSDNRVSGYMSADFHGVACNHPSLISKNFTDDKEAVEPKGAEEGKDVDEADELADLFGEMGVSGAAKKCQMCQAPSVLLPS